MWRILIQFPLHFAVFQGKGINDRVCCGEGIKPDVALSQPCLSVLAHRPIPLSRMKICPGWWFYGKRKDHGVST